VRVRRSSSFTVGDGRAHLAPPARGAGRRVHGRRLGRARRRRLLGPRGRGEVRARRLRRCAGAFIEAVGLGRAHVAGLSWGGVLAQELYRRHAGSVTSLILADTYAGWKGSLSKAECARRLVGVLEQTSLPEEDFDATLPGLFGEAPPADPREELASIMADVRPASMRRTAVAMAGSDRRDLLGSIEVPTLLIWGEADARSPLHVAEQLRDGIPGARLVVIPGAGHVSNMERPARFNEAVRDFCRSV
jgi:pimeloyl-ACP methyl ester carboxylesterase